MLLNIGFFHEKSKKKLKFFKIFQIPKFLEKIEFSKKNFTLQIALKNSLFELWPNKKICNEILSWRLHFQKNYWRARTSARGARWISYRCENSKIMFFGIGGRIFWARERQKFFKIEKFMIFCISYILSIFLYHLNSWF